ncbi:hypothetical protein N9B82_01640 [Saprospiraceae bacterium]|nr:hypothetical protein [Saprospiraceae bacterium]
MNPIVRNVIVVILGLIIGMTFNMGGIMGGMALFPGPEGMTMDPDSMAKYMPQFSTINLIVPIVAHAIGTLAAAIFIGRMAANNEKALCLIPGVVFLLGGISMAMQLPAPMWMEVTDLIVAYIPMSILGYVIGTAGKN